MHPVLCVSKFLLEIFSHVYSSQPGPWSMEPSVRTRMSIAARVSRKSLAALARTCKAFHEPAMYYLWADLNGITPLLGCVPRLRPIRVVGGWQGFCPQGIEPLSEAETHQFLRHAAHVRVLNVQNNTHFPLLTVLQPEAAETCLFPGLWSLSWRVSDTRYLQCLISPALRRLSISKLSSDMESIIGRCPALEDLSINRAFGNTTDELSLVSNTVRSCKRLVNLSCAPLDWAAWNHLSNIPTLLTVTIDGQFPSPLTWDHLKFAPFLKLTALSFASDAVTDITPVIRRAEFPALQRFDMHIPGFTTAKAEQFFHALSQCKASQTLEHIVIDSSYLVLKDDEEWGTPLTAIRQFLCFTQLQTLQLKVCHAIDIDNDLLVEAMSSWPHLRSLELDGYSGLPQPAVTFRALFTALRFCPHLHTLQVMIDAVNIDIDPTTESFRHASLKTLRVGNSSLGDAEVVARIIFTMLPFVDRVGDLRRSWHQVNLRLESFRPSAASGGRVTEAAPIWRQMT
ncbi:hypothetical protein DEU56DRAFT_831018 [Suillus clintonianus]|uniref:uncharacterized protein n=1 Tax=Suillus clintonianus TaxID=1904413 RepID=UPI001B87D9D3|nr:uncharacterized protein DEU56DRAFT_831018 [Suillus clintonianus]KAG2122917.1 hypothetical protein DEU56DRAFT_831018 [Suillus clintonianus]